jgi:hypothetical protein
MCRAISKQFCFFHIKIKDYITSNGIMIVNADQMAVIYFKMRS